MESWRHQFSLIHSGLQCDDLRMRILEFEQVIFGRLRELGHQCDSTEERNEIAEAMQKIRRFQVEQLHYPDIGSC